MRKRSSKVECCKQCKCCQHGMTTLSSYMNVHHRANLSRTNFVLVPYDNAITCMLFVFLSFFFSFLTWSSRQEVQNLKSQKSQVAKLTKKKSVAHVENGCYQSSFTSSIYLIEVNRRWSINS